MTRSSSKEGLVAALPSESLVSSFRLGAAKGSGRRVHVIHPIGR